MNNQADFPAPATPGGMAPEFFIKTLRYTYIVQKVYETV